MPPKPSPAKPIPPSGGTGAKCSRRSHRPKTRQRRMDTREWLEWMLRHLRACILLLLLPCIADAQGDSYAHSFGKEDQGPQRTVFSRQVQRGVAPPRMEDNAVESKGNVTVIVDCPAVDITRLSLIPNVWQVSREVGSATATMPDRKVLKFADFEIPPTLVFKKLIGHEVAACNQFGYSDDMDQLYIELPKERVIAGVAKKMTAKTTLTMHDGRVFTGSVVYPACRSRWIGVGRREAEAVVATGSWTQ